jgi:hypothetical protein
VTRPAAVRRALRRAALGVVLLTIGGPLWSAAMARLSADLVPSVSERATSLVTLRVTAVTVTKSAGGEHEQGRLVGEVVEVFRSDRLKPKDPVEIAFERAADPVAREHQGFDHWNVLPLRNGQLIIFALRPLDPPRRWTALAASAIDAVGAPYAVALREAVRLESSPALPDERRELLRGALGKDQNLLVLYVLDALGRRRVLDRLTGIDVLASALAAHAGTPAARDAIVDSLTRSVFFDGRLGADGGNIRIVGALAGELVSETHPERRAQILRYLASTVLGSFSRDAAQDAGIRTAIVKRVQAPAPADVRRVLTELSGQGSEGEQRLAQRLLEVWTAAHAAGA